MEYIQAYHFTIKHKNEVTNKVAYVLSKRNMTIQEVRLESVGIHSMKGMYEGDEDFVEAYHVCKEMNDRYDIEFSDFIL